MKREGRRLFTGQQLIGTIAAGVMIGSVLVSVSEPRFWQRASKQNVIPEKVVEPTPLPLYSKNIRYCGYLCYKPPEKPKPVAVKRPAQPGITRLRDLPKKIKNPNSIRISIAEAPPIRSKVKRVNGKLMCDKKGDKPKKSKQYSNVHIDQQCCLDPDEIPNPRCTY